MEKDADPRQIAKEWFLKVQLKFYINNGVCSRKSMFYIFSLLSLLFALFNCFAAMKLNTVLLYVIFFVFEVKWSGDKV